MDIPIHEEDAGGLIGQTLPGTRLEIVAGLGSTPYGELYRAVYSGGNKRPVAVGIVRRDLLAPSRAFERLMAEVGTAQKLDHKNIVKTLAMGAAQGRTHVVLERVEGQTLRTVLAERGAPQRPPFGLKTAYNIIAHLCNALTHAHGLTPHGGINPSNIIINKAGRVKLAGFGLARALPAAHLLGREETAADRAAVAPELAKAPDKIDLRADIYSLGAILFELLTGKPPSERQRKLSSVAAGLPAELESVVQRCLAPSPLGRYADAGKLKHALAEVLDKYGPNLRAIPLSGEIFDESEERWLVSQKGNLDIGPFNLLQIKEQIGKDQIVPGDFLVDKESHNRTPVEDHPALHELVAQAVQRRDDYRRAHAEAVVVKQEKRKGLALYLFLLGGALALGGGVFVVLKYLKGGGRAQREQETALLGGTEIKGLKLGGAKREDDKGAPRRRGPRNPNAKPGDPGFDDSQSLDMGGGDDGVGDERLDNDQINGVLSRHSGALGGCLVEEARRGGSRHADIEFIIQGSGRVSSVRVNGETGSALAGCIRSRMQAMQFPPFNGTRTKASFDMGI